MNYIKHLTGFFDRVVRDNNLNPTHISLYVSLFQFWNVNRFVNPISISRDEVMRISKISAKATYHKCMKELHKLGYLRYEPSYNPFRGSLVHLMNFSEDLKPVQKRVQKNKAKIKPANEQVLNKHQPSSGTSAEQALVPYTNSLNITNNLNTKNKGEPLQKIDVKILQPVKEEKEKLRQKKKKDFLPPEVGEVEEYFVQQKYPLVEAQKFHNYFQSNGWLVGGKTPMKDWKASSRNWMLNANKFASGKTEKPKAKHLHATTNKNYSEPL